MIRARILLAAMGLGLLLGAAAPPPASETITIRWRFNYFACAGFCTDSDLVARPDGKVMLRVRPVKGAWRYFSYRVTPEQLAAFRRELSRYRPVGTPPPTGDCHHPEYVEGLLAFDIRWQGGGPAGRLRSCVGEDVATPVQRAYLALAILPGVGTRLSPEDVEDYAARIR